MCPGPPANYSCVFRHVTRTRTTLSKMERVALIPVACRGERVSSMSLKRRGGRDDNIHGKATLVALGNAMGGVWWDVVVEVWTLTSLVVLCVLRLSAYHVASPR